MQNLDEKVDLLNYSSLSWGLYGLVLFGFLDAQFLLSRLEIDSNHSLNLCIFFSWGMLFDKRSIQS